MNRPTTDFGRRSSGTRPQEHAYNNHEYCYLLSISRTVLINIVHMQWIPIPMDVASVRPGDPEWDILSAYDKVGSPSKYIASKQYASDLKYNTNLIRGAGGGPVDMPVSESGATS